MTRLLALLSTAVLLSAAAVSAMPWPFVDGTAQVTNKDGTIAYQGSHGAFNVPHNVPMYHDAQFPIASNTKLFTAVSLYQLQEKGLVNISENIAKYLNATDFANFGHPTVTKYCPTMASNPSGPCEEITFRQLLSMSSGIYATMRCDPQPGMTAYCNPSPFVLYPGSIAAMVGTFITNPLDFKPGTQYEYSNPNFILTAYFIEKLSGMSYRDYLQQNIFDVVGMKKTYFDPYNNQFEENPNRVNEYQRFIDSETNTLMSTGRTTVDFDLGSLSGTGGIVSTVDDVNKWYRMLFNMSSMGAPLLKDPRSLESILTPWTVMQPPGPLPSFYSQGVTILCAKDDPQCVKGPTFVIYEGGTLVVHTANIFDLRNDHTGSPRYQMTQVFTNSLRINCTRATFEMARTKGNLNFYRLAAMMSSYEPDAMGLAWQLQAEHGPSPLG